MNQKKANINWVDDQVRFFFQFNQSSRPFVHQKYSFDVNMNEKSILSFMYGGQEKQMSYIIDNKSNNIWIFFSRF